MTAADECGVVLDVRDLVIQYRTARQVVHAVRGVSLQVARGQTLALVGESGSGKSTTAHAINRLLPRSANVSSGSISLNGRELGTLSDRAFRRVGGREIGFVPQDPTVSLNPVLRVGDQVAEVLRIHSLAPKSQVASRVIEALQAAGIDRPQLRARQYPHQLSGGLRQRVLIAIAIIARPALIVADEPTSALDVTVQRQILDHIEHLSGELGTGVLLVTHDLAVAADRAHKIAVMSQGLIVETGDPDQILGDPQHRYTKDLIAAAPSLNSGVTPRRSTRARVREFVGVPGDPFDTRGPKPDLPQNGSTTDPVPLLSAVGLVKDFAVPRLVAPDGLLRAVDDVSIAIGRGATLALVGESGSGKSTTARLVLRLLEPTAGVVSFDGHDVTGSEGKALRTLRRKLQVVQQNPYTSLDPRLTIQAAISEPLAALRLGTRRQRLSRAADLLDLVGLPASFGRRKPSELSGGQRQRVAIARALTVNPELIVLDEPVSALDVRVQAQILDLVADLQTQLGVSYLFISHDLAVVRQVAHEIGVMKSGRLLEAGPADEVFNSPRCDYTRELLNAIPGSRVRT